MLPEGHCIGKKTDKKQNKIKQNKQKEKKKRKKEKENQPHHHASRRHIYFILHNSLVILECLRQLSDTQCEKNVIIRNLFEYQF